MTDQTTNPARRYARMPAEPTAPKSLPAAAPDTVSTAKPEAAAVASSASRPESKIASVTGLLERDEGASLAELVTATGWLPHTTRAALTGLKKKGHVIVKAKVDNVTRYSITKAAAA